MRSNRLSQSSSFSRKRRRRAILAAVSGLLAIGSWLFVFSRLSFLPALTITQISVYGVDGDLTQVMNAAATRAMEGAYMGLFSKANAFIYPHDEISRRISSSSPQVNNVTVKRNGLRSLAISVSERTPEAIVCADLPDLADDSLNPGDDCYVADGRGFIFRHLRKTDAKTHNQFYMPDLAGKNLLGVYATTTEKFNTLQTLMDSIKDSGISIHAILVKGGGAYELYADNPSGSSIVVIVMDERADLDAQRENLTAFWSKMVGDARIKGAALEWNEIKLQYPPNVYHR